jgi:heme/copper-type cytochrome/quinol oxidase subunit 4
MSAQLDTAQPAHSHPAAHGSAKYFKVGFVLFVLTGLEVLLYEVCYGHLHVAMGGFSVALAPWFVEILLALSAAKFWLVAMFYMHLKDDMGFLSWVFAAALTLAAIIISALVALFIYNRGLWWASGVWK